MTEHDPATRVEPTAARFDAELAALYDALDAAVAAHGPACAISGRCCRFEEYGHTLFLSAPELDYLLAQAPAPAQSLDTGATCPWQDDRGRCTARAARPLGCRVYFCDPAFQDHIGPLSERFIARLKALVDRHGLDWSYAPLHRHLHAARDRGAYVDPTGSGGAPVETVAGPPVKPPAPHGDPAPTILP